MSDDVPASPYRSHRDECAVEARALWERHDGTPLMITESEHAALVVVLGAFRFTARDRDWDEPLLALAEEMTRDLTYRLSTAQVTEGLGVDAAHTALMEQIERQRRARDEKGDTDA